jgi:hypothetical protein
MSTYFEIGGYGGEWEGAVSSTPPFSEDGQEYYGEVSLPHQCETCQNGPPRVHGGRRKAGRSSPYRVPQTMCSRILRSALVCIWLMRASVTPSSAPISASVR